jgi:hypothetical protein
MIGHRAGALVTTGTERTARSPAGPALTRRAVGSECNLIVLDACDVMAAFAKSWRRERPKAPSRSKAPS